MCNARSRAEHQGHIATHRFEEVRAQTMAIFEVLDRLNGGTATA